MQNNEKFILNLQKGGKDPHPHRPFPIDRCVSTTIELWEKLDKTVCEKTGQTVAKKRANDYKRSARIVCRPLVKNIPVCSLPVCHAPMKLLHHIEQLGYR